MHTDQIAVNHLLLIDSWTLCRKAWHWPQILTYPLYITYALQIRKLTPAPVHSNLLGVYVSIYLSILSCRSLPSAATKVLAFNL